MSVYTTVTESQLVEWLKNYSLGRLIELQGIASGIENTNYFVTTSHGKFVLTLFEKLHAADLPYYIHLMAHLANHGTPCPKPVANNDNEFIGHLNGKPACIVSCLPGKSVENVTPAQCGEAGAMLADMHQAAHGYAQRMGNPRGPHWWSTFSQQVLPKVSPDEAALIENELTFQASHKHDTLPRGVIHGDLFRDNVLFTDGRIGGVIDFYFACNDVLLFDVAITVNDWCMNADATPDGVRASALLQGYHASRPFSEGEIAVWPVMLRAAAFRTWLGRLGYNYFPMEGEMTHTKDAQHYQRMLQQHIEQPQSLRALLHTGE
jgi:homoserine kinase type II